MMNTYSKLSALACIGLLASCGAGNQDNSKQQAGEKELPPPNILWINCEDINPNLGCYGDNFATTPNLDALASEGILFNQAWATAPISSPSRTCLITGLYATSMGTQHLRSHVDLPKFIETLPEYLSENGYFTTLMGKTDYNFNPDKPSERYDYCHWVETYTPWRKRGNKPFFSYFVFGMTHEGSCNKEKNWKRNTKDLHPSLFHDASRTPLPPKYPKTPEMQKIWARYYDNITVLDSMIGLVVDSLEQDGLKDSTIIFFFSDHGAGMPGHKRWLNASGLRVPFIVYVPKAYQHLSPFEAGSKTDQLVNFSDFAPTVMNLAGLQIPETMEGIAFMGKEQYPKRNYTTGARERADNMYECSRSISNGQFHYIRHFKPHVPYMQAGYIFSDIKDSFRELTRLRKAGQLNPEFEAYYQPKGIEELYDLSKDPHELNNLAQNPEYQNKKADLKAQLYQWIVENKDIGLLHEADYMARAQGSTPYEIGHKPDTYNIEAVLAAADKVGTGSLDDYVKLLKSSDSGVRYWGIIGLQTLGDSAKDAADELAKLLNDPSPAVKTEAAYTLCLLDAHRVEANAALKNMLNDERDWVVLHAARSIELIGNKAQELVPALQETIDRYKATPDSKKRYRDSDFATFISWSVKWALHHCGQSVDITN